MCGRAVTDHHGHPVRVPVELFASAYCIAGCNTVRLNFRRKKGGIIRPKGIFSKPFGLISSGGFGWSQTFFKKKKFPSSRFIFISLDLLFHFLSSLFSLHIETELTRQVTPPTENGHAPRSIESRESYLSVHLYCMSEPGELLVLRQIEPQAPLLVVPTQTSSKTGTALIAVALVI